MIEIALEADEDWDSSRSWEDIARKAARAAIAESDYPELADTDRTVEISVTLTGDEQVRALNSEWRGKDKPTNVLSFPMAEEYELRDRQRVRAGDSWGSRRHALRRRPELRRPTRP